MSAFFDEIRSSLARDMGLVGSGEQVETRHKDKLREKLGLTKGQMSNIYFRNESEFKGKNILLVQVLLDGELSPTVREFINANVSNKKGVVSELDVWGIEKCTHEEIQNDGFDLLCEDDTFVVKVRPEKVFDNKTKRFENTKRMQMKIYRKPEC